jgi:hypothetical protein
MFFVCGAERRTTKRNVEGKHETSHAAAAVMQGAKTMTMWQRSAQPTAAIYGPVVRRIKIRRSSDRFFNYKQRGSPSGGQVAGAGAHAAAPPGA